MKLEINIDDPEVISAIEGVQITPARKKALIKIDSKGSNGKNFEITLKANGRK